MTLLDVYRAVHQQCFVPIFTEHDNDPEMLVEASLSAGCKVIEYTLRRRDVRRIIPWVRRTYPDLIVLAGSTLDSDDIVRTVRRGVPEFPTFKEVQDMGVHGFVTMVGFQESTLHAYRDTHLLVPAVCTLTEAYRAVVAGAHFCKMFGPELELVRVARAAPTHGFCPIMVTGGMSLDRIPDTIAAGAVFLGAGFDLMLRGQAGARSVESVADELKRYLETAQQRQRETWPKLGDAATASDAEWLQALPHHHPFGPQPVATGAAGADER